MTDERAEDPQLENTVDTGVIDDRPRSPCPQCGELILDVAVKCRFCGEATLDRSEAGPPADPPAVVEPVWERAPEGWVCIRHRRTSCDECSQVSPAPTGPAAVGAKHPVRVRTEAERAADQQRARQRAAGNIARQEASSNPLPQVPKLKSETIASAPLTSGQGMWQRIDPARRVAAVDQPALKVGAAIGWYTVAISMWLVFFTWTICVYVFFGIFALPLRLIGRGRRKRKREALRHRETLETIEGGKRSKR